jgi:all-trans-retinol 13,14-reductase
MVDVSTPLSISHYLRPTRGGGVGLDQTPTRYTDWNVQRHLDAETDIGGFFLTGQDTVICGVVLAQMSGWITACRILGQHYALKFILQSIFCMESDS